MWPGYPAARAPHSPGDAVGSVLLLALRERALVAVLGLGLLALRERSDVLVLRLRLLALGEGPHVLVARKLLFALGERAPIAFLVLHCPLLSVVDETAWCADQTRSATPCGRNIARWRPCAKMPPWASTSTTSRPTSCRRRHGPSRGSARRSPRRPRRSAGTSSGWPSNPTVRRARSCATPRARSSSTSAWTSSSCCGARRCGARSPRASCSRRATSWRTARRPRRRPSKVRRRGASHSRARHHWVSAD